MITDFISVIIPVYNASGTLDRCIQSVLHQTYKNLEIIIIDDGSSDNSFSICHKYSLQDSRIHFISQANQGVSAARNKGLVKASGKYISFVDADDWIEPSTIELLHKGIVFQSDVVLSVIGIVDDNKYLKRIKTIIDKNKSALIDWTVSIREIISIDGLRGYVWNKLFINTNELFFDDKIQVTEDLDFCIQYLIRYKNGYSYLIDVPSYHYNQNNSGRFIANYPLSKWLTQIYSYQKNDSSLAKVNQDFSRYFRGLEGICEFTILSFISLGTTREQIEGFQIDQNIVRKLNLQFKQNFKYSLLIDNSFTKRLSLFLFNYYPSLYFSLLKKIKNINRKGK